MVPLYGPHACPSCRFVGAFVGVDWYVCKGRPEAMIIGRFSQYPHDQQARFVYDIRSGGPWKRAVLLAQAAGLL
jgi:hypothetical protein